MHGPFTEAKELIGGFYIIEVMCLEEAIEWALRCPTGLGFDDVLEIRQLTGAVDLPPEILDLIKAAADLELHVRQGAIEHRQRQPEAIGMAANPSMPPAST